MATSGNAQDTTDVWEIPFWIFGQQKWVSNISKNTTCQEIVRALFRNFQPSDENGGSSSPADPSQFTLVEKWRKIERPLEPTSRVVKVWLAWGEDNTEVKLVLKRIQSSPRRKKYSKVSRANQSKLDTVHPRNLYKNDKEKCKESIQKLIKIIITQGNTIQSQLQALSDKGEAIESFEEKMHILRMKESGRDYLLHTYLDHLPQKSPTSTSQNQRSKFSVHQHKSSSSPPISPKEIPPHQIDQWTVALENIHSINKEVTKQEEELVKLYQNCMDHLYGKENTGQVLGPDLKNVLRLPKEEIEGELLHSEKEIQRAHEELKKIERDLTFIKERTLAGDIYIQNLIADLDSAEREGVELQKEFECISHLPPSAFASKEMLDWLKRDLSDGEVGDIDSELDLSPNQTMEAQSENILLPDQVHPHFPCTAGSTSTRSNSSGFSSTSPGFSSKSPEFGTTSPGFFSKLSGFSSSTGSTSSGFSSDIHSISPEPQVVPQLPKPPMISKNNLSQKFADLDIDDLYVFKTYDARYEPSRPFEGNLHSVEKLCCH